MSSSPIAPLTDQEFALLLEQYCDGLLFDVADVERFAGELRRDADRRRWFYEYHDLHAELRWLESASRDAANLDPQTTHTAPSAPVVTRSLTSLWRHAWKSVNTTISLSLLIAGWTVLMVILAMSFARLQPLELEPPSPVPQFTAQLLTIDDTALLATDPTQLPPPGDYLVAGQVLRLEAGRLSMRFGRDAWLELLGPAELKILSASSAELLAGRCFAQVGRQGQGFVVHTALVEVTDLGTEFSVIVAEGPERDVEVAVYQGRVEARAKNANPNAKPASLSAGQLALFDRAGHTLTRLDAQGLQAARARFFVRPPQGTVAYVAERGTIGNQKFDGALGMDFEVVEPIVITELGVFDSGQDGLQRPITVRLYQQPDDGPSQLLATREFAGKSGVLLGGSRFLPLAKAVLAEGFNGRLPAGFRGTIVAEGYGAEEMNGNAGAAKPTQWAIDNGGGQLRFLGCRYGPAGEFPATPDGSAPNRYAAGTFAFRAQETTPTTPPPTNDQTRL